MRFLSTPIAGILMAILLLAGLSSPGQAELSSADKKQVETLIENFIRENPVLLRDVLTRLAEAEAEAAKENVPSVVHVQLNEQTTGSRLTLTQLGERVRRANAPRRLVKDRPVLVLLHARAAFSAVEQVQNRRAGRNSGHHIVVEVGVSARALAAV